MKGVWRLPPVVLIYKEALLTLLILQKEKLVRHHLAQVAVTEQTDDRAVTQPRAHRRERWCRRHP